MTAGMTLAVVVLGTWIGVAGAGGVAYLLVKPGRTSLGASGLSDAEGSDARPMRAITLAPVLANLADAGGHAYVRLGLRVEIAGTGAVQVQTAAAGKDTANDTASDAGASSSELESSIRDTVLAVLERQTSAYLLGPDGKEHLKIELKEAIERGAVRVDVKDLFFTDFLVQI
jgi:flagellar FliL protein